FTVERAGYHGLKLPMPLLFSRRKVETEQLIVFLRNFPRQTTFPNTLAIYPLCQLTGSFRKRQGYFVAKMNGVLKPGDIHSKNLCHIWPLSELAAHMIPSTQSWVSHLTLNQFISQLQTQIY